MLFMLFVLAIIIFILTIVIINYDILWFIAIIFIFSRGNCKSWYFMWDCHRYQFYYCSPGHWDQAISCGSMALIDLFWRVVLIVSHVTLCGLWAIWFSFDPLIINNDILCRIIINVIFILIVVTIDHYMLCRYITDVIYFWLTIIINHIT